MRSTRGRRMNFSLIIFFVCLLLSFVAWDHYLNSPDPINQQFASLLVLLSGFLFSCLAGFAVWTLESRTDYLEREVVKRTRALLQKEQEQKVIETASIAACWLSQVIFTNQKYEDLFDSVIALVKKVLQADDASLMLLNENKELVIAASSGIPDEIMKNTHLKVGDRVAGRAVACKREFLIIGSLRNYPEFQGIDDNASISSSIVCPLLCNGEAIGVLNLNRTQNTEPFLEIHLRHALIMASQISQVIYNERMNRSLNRKEDELVSAHRKLKNMGVDF